MLTIVSIFFMILWAVDLLNALSLGDFNPVLLVIAVVLLLVEFISGPGDCEQVPRNS